MVGNSFPRLAWFFESDKPGPHGGDFQAFLQKTAQVVPATLRLSDIFTQVFSVDDFLREKVQVCVLVILIQWIHLIPVLAEIPDQLPIGFLESLGMPEALDGVHRVVLAYGIDPQPFDLLINTPLRKVWRKTRVFNHIAKFIRVRADPTILVPAGLQDQDISLSD